MSRVLETIENGTYKLSQSRLKKLLGTDYDPRSFLSEYNGQSVYTLMGHYVEALLCFPNKIKDMFVTCECPTGQMKKFIDYLIDNKLELNEYNFKLAHEHAKMKRSKIETVISKFEDNFMEYYEISLKSDGELMFVTKDIVRDSSSLAHKMLMDEFVGKYFEKKSTRYKVFYQVYVEFTILGGVECKGIIDQLIVDYENKTIEIIDIKTTGEETYKRAAYRRRWDIQGAFYYLGINNYTSLVCEGEDISSYVTKGFRVLSPTFLVGHTTKNIKPLVYKMSARDIEVGQTGDEERGIEGYIQLINKYLWYKKNGWDTNIEIINNGGFMHLNLWNERKTA